MRSEDRKPLAYGALSLLATIVGVVVPMKYPTLWPAALDFLLWGGVTGIIVCIVWLFYEHLDSDAQKWWRQHRVTYLIGMILGGILFLGSAGWYFWPASVVGPKKPDLSPSAESDAAEITIHNLFLDDFQGGSFKIIRGLFTPLYKAGRNIGDFPFEFGIYGDFQSKSAFMSFYAPGSEHSVELISWFAESYKDYLYDTKKNIHVWTASLDAQNQPISDDLVFTGKIYIYHENIFSAEQVRTLINLYASHGVEAVFRGFNYMEYRKKAGPLLSANFGKGASSSAAPPKQTAHPWHAFTPDPSNQKQPTLFTLFVTDFHSKHGFYASRVVTLRFEPGDAAQNIPVAYALYFDETSHKMIATVYVSYCYYATDVVIFVASQLRAWIDEVMPRMKTKLDTNQYHFDGVVYLYMEDQITDASAKELLSHAMTENLLKAEYRSTDYLMAIRYEIETNRRRPPPFYTLIDGAPTLLAGQIDPNEHPWSKGHPAVTPVFPVPPGTPEERLPK